MVETVYLVIGADREIRVVKRPRLSESEVAFRINLTYPKSWGRVIGDINIDLPESAPTAQLAQEANDG